MVCFWLFGMVCFYSTNFSWVAFLEWGNGGETEIRQSCYFPGTHCLHCNVECTCIQKALNMTSIIITHSLDHLFCVCYGARCWGYKDGNWTPLLPSVVSQGAQTSVTACVNVYVIEAQGAMITQGETLISKSVAELVPKFKSSLKVVSVLLCHGIFRLCECI